METNNDFDILQAVISMLGVSIHYSGLIRGLWVTFDISRSIFV